MKAAFCKKDDENILKILSYPDIFSTTNTGIEIKKREIEIPPKSSKEPSERWILYEMKDKCFIVTKTQQLYVFGTNNYGELGISTIGEIKTPTLVKIPLEEGEEIKLIYSNEGSTFIETTRSKLYACGWNGNGKLGIGAKNDYIYKFEPVVLSFIERDGGEIKSICTGWDSTFIETTTSKLYACGWNNKGQLGFASKNDYIYKFEPVVLSFIERDGEEIKSIYSNADSTFIETTSSKLYACGWNNKGKLGIGSKNKYIYKFEPVLLSFIERDGEEIKSICTGWDSTFIETTTSKVYACGFNYKGLLGINSKEENIYKPEMVLLSFQKEEKEDLRKIYKFNYATFFETTRSKLYVCGLSNWSQLESNPIEDPLAVNELYHASKFDV